MGSIKLLVFCTLFVFNYVLAGDKAFMCYYGSWASYRPGNGKFEVSNIDANLCTHLVYAFVGINEMGEVISLDPWLDLPYNEGKNYFGKFNGLKRLNPNLKTILAVGGWNEGSSKYSVMAANATLRQNFIHSSLSMILQNGFDGFDLDWEYPNQRDTVHGLDDIENFSTLCKELKEAYAPYGLLLTAAVAAVEQSASLSYDVPAISKYLDYINLMTYDFYGAWDVTTGLNAPLYYSGNFSIEKAVDYWIDAGCPPEKILLGMPLYGRTFQLTDSQDHSVGAPSSGAGLAGPYTATNGVVGYNELCNFMQSQTWTNYWDETSKVPYTVKDNNWVSYDNPESLYIKAKYAVDKNLGGGMVWSIETDDFHGLCHNEKFPLMNTIQRTLNGIEFQTQTPSFTNPIAPDPSSSSSSSTSTSTTTVATSSISSAAVCEEEGFNKHPTDCKSFYVCIRNPDGTLKAFPFTCPGELNWDQNNTICNYPENVSCTT